MQTTPIEFLSRDGRKIVLRQLNGNDVRAATRFANNLAAEKRTNRDLGIVSLERKVTLKDERKFLNRIIRGTRTLDEISLAAFDGHRMVAHCHVSRRRQGDVRHTAVYGISVLDRYRGVGIGRRLTEEVLRNASQMGVWLIELEVMGINEEAIRLYEKTGFRRAGVIPNKILRDGRHIDIVVMYADLRNDKFPPRPRGKS